MPLYGCQTPDGYKNTQASWLNPDAMTRRISFATSLASGRLNDELLGQQMLSKSTNPSLHPNLSTPFNLRIHWAIDSL